MTATRNDNNETASVSSDVATVTVSPKSYDFSTNTISCAITQDENGYSVHLTEGEGSANQLSISGTVADLEAELPRIDNLRLVVVADSAGLPRDRLAEIVRLCERLLVRFTLLPFTTADASAPSTRRAFSSVPVDSSDSFS